MALDGAVQNVSAAKVVIQFLTTTLAPRKTSERNRKNSTYRIPDIFNTAATTTHFEFPPNFPILEVIKNNIKTQTCSCL